MNSLLKNPTHVAKIGYQGFNMENYVDYTCAPCQLLPLYYDVLNPGDKVHCSSKINVRTQPLESAATLKALVRTDWFAVPFEQIYKFFGGQYYNIQDVGTNFVQVGQGLQPRTTLPYFTIKSLVQQWCNYYTAMMQDANVPFDETNVIDYAPYEGNDAISNFNYYQKLSCLNDTMRLMDCLGIPVDNVLMQGNNLTGSIFPLLPCAYQKIYYDFYRLSDRQINDPAFYNVDSYLTPSTSVISAASAFNFYRLHYIPWNKDYFTNVFLSPLVGQQTPGMFLQDIQQFNNWLTGMPLGTYSPSSSNVYLPSGNQQQDTQTPTNVSVSPNTTNNTAATILSSMNAASKMFTTANIRGMFAMEKALEITRRAGKHYDAQTLAHWGVNVPKQLAGEVIHLGSEFQPLIIGDVISTAESGQQPLGTIAGKGYSTFDKDNGSYRDDISFVANCHTVLMAVSTVIPELRYTQRMLDKLNCLTSPADWVHPETDNLGQQPIFTYQMYYTDDGHSADVAEWQFGYSESKIKYNKVFGNVHASGTLYSWVPQFDFKDYYVRNTGLDQSHLYRFMGNPMWLNKSLTYKYLYLTLWDKDASESNLLTDCYARLYSRDPFICSAAFNVVKSSKMSKYSLPQL